MDLYSSEEQNMVAGCKKNESWARKKLYELYAPAMLGVCFRYTNDRETAKDVLHEGFIKVFTKINSFSGGSLNGWIRRIFTLTALEFLRSEQSWRQIGLIDHEEKLETVDTSAVEKLSAEDILKCIAELPKGCRVIFNLYAIEGYSHAEIAEMLNIKEVTSRSQFAYARQLLQNRVQKLHIHMQPKKKYG
jgi:RNA polymerase sigma-70 factor (ECF subfamily)